MSRRTGRGALLAGAVLALAGLVLSGCTGPAEQPKMSDSATPVVDCGELGDYGHFDAGTRVTIRGPVIGMEAQLLNDSFGQFETCTGINVDYTGSKEFATGIVVQAQEENGPDLAIFPQPSLLKSMATAGFLVPAPAEAKKNLAESWSAYWTDFGTVDEKIYGSPLTATVKGYIWYSPAEFEAHGYQVPETLDELLTLTETIAADARNKPWCDGFLSGDASGWPGTDWLEDVMLRQAGAATYDKWVNHQIPFNAPSVERALDYVGTILKDPAYVNGGFDGVKSIATTEFADAGLPILDGQCSLYHQASFYEGFWDAGGDAELTIASDGDIWAFMMPGTSADISPVVVGADLLGSFNDDAATQAVHNYLSSVHWANVRVGLGGVISANLGVDSDLASSDLLAESIRLLQKPTVTVRFDGSDVMPTAVGSGSFWAGMTDWINGQSTADTLTAIEQSWPKSGG